MGKPDWGSAVSGGVSGAGAGGAIGGPWGAAIGGVTGFFGGLFGGKKKKKPKKLSTLDKNQQKLNQTQHDAVMGKGELADLYNYDPQKANAVFDSNVSRPAYRNFAENQLPTITGAFRSKGLQNSSYIGDSIGRLARDIEEDLNAKRSSFMYNQESDSKNAKRNAVENLQNRQTFAYEKDNGAGSKGFDINSIINTASKADWGSMADTAIKYLPGGV